MELTSPPPGYHSVQGSAATKQQPSFFDVNALKVQDKVLSIKLSNPNIAQPTGSPDVTTTYTLTATSGGCSAVDEITITVIDEPINIPSLDPFAIIC